jgi:WW domain-containing oxidoreductase
MTQRKSFGRRSTADRVLAGIDLSGKHILVTGCHSGTGFATAGALAANGAHVIAAARTHHEAAQACRDIGYHCSPLECDFGDLQSIAAAAESVRRLQTPLDGILANSGFADVAATRACHGVEEHFLVNYLGHFALLSDLAGVVREATGRIVLVTSRAAGWGGIANGIMFDNLDGRRSDQSGDFHTQSKFANALYAKELSRRLLARGIAVNSVNPGVAHDTGPHQNHGMGRRLARLAALPFRRKPAQAAATIALLLASPSVTGITGEYWQDCAIARGNPLLNDDAMATRLWETSEAALAAYRESRAQSLPKAA